MVKNNVCLDVPTLANSHHKRDKRTHKKIAKVIFRITVKNETAKLNLISTWGTIGVFLEEIIIAIKLRCSCNKFLALAKNLLFSFESFVV